MTDFESGFDWGEAQTDSTEVMDDAFDFWYKHTVKSVPPPSVTAVDVYESYRAWAVGGVTTSMDASQVMEAMVKRGHAYRVKGAHLELEGIELVNNEKNVLDAMDNWHPAFENWYRECIEANTDRSETIMFLYRSCYRWAQKNKWPIFSQADMASFLKRKGHEEKNTVEGPVITTTRIKE